MFGDAVDHIGAHGVTYVHEQLYDEYFFVSKCAEAQIDYSATSLDHALTTLIGLLNHLILVGFECIKGGSEVADFEQ